ncbi:MAG: hypothetical protein JRH11_11455, partial [Deltaproteobacteria bacterium]|nr:hypothetical protein [Deltaproteobacteria bacterium]
ACAPVPANAIGNLGDGHRAHSIAVLDGYGPGSVFSGVYNVDSGRVLMRPSGSTTLRTGAAAPQAVSQDGGHEALAAELEALTGLPQARNIGFVAFYDEIGKISVSNWKD